MSHKIMPATAIAVLCAAAAVAAAQSTYQITHLGVPDGAIEVMATAINSHGHVVGFTDDGAKAARPFVWIDGTMTILHVPDGFPGAVPTAVSDTGVVSGNAWTNGSWGLPDALMWPTIAGEPAFLPTLGGARAGAYGISPDGEIITGWSYGPNTQVSLKAFRYHLKTGAIEDIGLLPTTGVMGADGVAINALHQIIGLSGGGGRLRSFIDDPIEGKMAIGTLGGLETRAMAISHAGHVAGWGQTGVPDQDAVEGTPRHAFLWHKGRMTDLGTLDGFIESRAHGVNSSATIVGTSFNHPFIGFPRRAFVWKDGEMSDLNDLIPSGTGWELQQAEAINDAGQIAGWGLLNGERRAFLLTPAR